MRIKKCSLFIFLLALLLSNKTKAQIFNYTHRSETNFQLNLGVMGMYGINPQKKPGGGASASLEYFVNDMVTARATLGFKQVNDQFGKRDFKYVPAQLGVKAYLQNNIYVSGDAGFAMGNRYVIDRYTKYWIIITPGIGYSATSNGLDLALQYDLLHRSNTYFSAVGIKISYTLPIGASNY